MASVELRPGDTLNIVWKALQNTPFGKREIESNFVFSYDDLMDKLRAKGRAGKSRRSGTEGAKFSRVVALSVNALRKGKWSTGASIEREVVFSKLMSRFQLLGENEFSNITSNARESLEEIYRDKKILSGKQRTELESMLAAIGVSI